MRVECLLGVEKEGRSWVVAWLGGDFNAEGAEFAEKRGGRRAGWEFCDANIRNYSMDLYNCQGILFAST